MKKYILIFILILTISSYSHGQEISYYNNLYNYSLVQNFQAPSVSALNTYGKIPVSLHTGTPNISIPIYTVKEHGITIPIELRYNINNVKPNTHPGITGLGWSLFAGGSITRIQRGDSYDERSQKGSPTFSNRSYIGNERALADDWKSYSFYSDMQVPSNEPWYGEQRLYNEIRNNPGVSITTNFSMYRPKTQPDKYIFNFLGYSGAFYRDHTGWWVVESEIPFEIEHKIITINATRSQIADTYKKVYAYYSSDGNEQTIEKFVLTAPDGVKFEFGGVNAIDYNVGLLRQSDKKNIPTATAWHLSKIITPNNNIIEFEYSVANPIMEGSYNFWIQSNYHDEMCGRGLYFQLVLPVLLKNIKSESSKNLVEFEYQNSTELKYKDRYFENSSIIDISWLLVTSNVPEETQIYTNKLFDKDESKDIKWNQLSKIKLPNETNYTFNYTNSTSERLKLLSLEKRHLTNNSVAERYDFKYHSTKLPDYLTGHYDHLGFYNGKDFSYTFDLSFYFHKTSGFVNNQFVLNPNRFTEQKVNADKFYNSREGDKTGQFVKAEILQEIHYPAGGYTKFDYEPQYISKIVSPNRQTVSTSSLNYPGGLRIKKIANYNIDNSFIDSKTYYYVSNFNKNTKTGISSGILGYTPQYYWDLALTSISPRNSSYNSSMHNENMKILTSGSTNQAYFNLDESAYVGYSEVIECIEDSNGNIQGYTQYKFSNFDNGNPDNLPLSSFNDINKTNVALSPYTPFPSNSNKRGKLIEKVVWDNNGKQKHTSHYKYTSLPITDRIGSLKDEIRGIIIYNISDEYGRNDQVYTDYKLGGSYSHHPYVYLLSEKTEKIVENSDTIKQTTYYEYNQEKNIVKEKTVLNNTEYRETRTKYTGDLFREGSAWKSPIYFAMDKKVMDSYPVEKVVIKNGNVITADITNYKGHYTEIYYPSEQYKLETSMPIPINQYQFVKIDGDSLKADSRCKKHSTISAYYKNVVPDYVENNSSKTVYLWSYNERYPIAKIENATYEEVMQAMEYSTLSYIIYFRSKSEPSSEDWSKINSLRTLLPNASVTTYKYKPFIGIVESTSPSGVTTHYEYDLFGRLEATYIEENGGKKKLQQYDYHYKNQ